MTQIVTIAAVLLGSLTTYVTNRLMERSKQQETRRVRWDDKKLDAYVDYVGHIRAMITAYVRLYEAREGIRAAPGGVDALFADASETGGRMVLAFERVMLLGGDSVVEAAHAVRDAMAPIEWQARGVVSGTSQEWQDRNTEVFRSVNNFHQCARADLGVTGSFEGDRHTARGLLVPGSRTG